MSQVEKQTVVTTRKRLFESRVILASLTLCWAIASAGLLINAIVKTDNLRGKIAALIPSPTVVTVNVAPIRVPAIFATVAVFFIMIIAFAELMDVIFSKPGEDRSTSCGLGFLLIFFLLWLLGDMVAMTYRYATREIQIKAWVDGNQVPDDVVKDIQNSIGFNWSYKQMGIWLVAIIFPWICWLFAALLTGVMFASTGDRIKEERTVPKSRAAGHTVMAPAVENIPGSGTAPPVTMPDAAEVPASSGGVDIPAEAAPRTGDVAANV